MNLKDVIFLFFLAAACSPDENLEDFEEPEIIRLLSGDSVKQWDRVRLSVSGTNTVGDDCSIKLRLIFIYPDGSDPNLEYEFRTIADFCSGIDSSVSSGICLVIDNSAFPSGTTDLLKFTTSLDTVQYGLVRLTSRFLEINRLENGNLIEETFEWAGY
ncbi:MAG TPA: hypothetical protein VI583_03780 [Cyclobacteriaceae bacterium]|nr:hypothetical protein [Cyclobacteriaceae bacterium]